MGRELARGVVGRAERMSIEALVAAAERGRRCWSGGVAARRRDRHPRPRARRVRLVAGRRRAVAGRGRRAAAADGSLLACRRSLMRAITFRRLEAVSFTHSTVYLALLVCAFVARQSGAGDVHPRPGARADVDRDVAGLHRRRAGAHHPVLARGHGRGARWPRTVRGSIGFVVADRAEVRRPDASVSIGTRYS